MKNLIDHYGNAPFGGVERREGSKQPWSSEATALDMLAAFDEDARFKSARRERH